MKTTIITTLAVLAASNFLGVQAASKTQPGAAKQSPAKIPIPNQQTSHGCYSSGGNLTHMKGVDFVSSGSCGDACREKKYWVMGLRADKCYCANSYPPEDDLTDDEDCNYPCPGFDQEACGSLKGETFSVFNTGLEIDVPDAEPEEEDDDDDDDKKSKTSTSSASSTKPATKSSAAETTTSSTGQPSSGAGHDGGEKEEKKDGPNVAAIAAGVVVGVVVMAAAIGVGIFFVRRRRNAEIEEEHRRNAAVNAFINGSKPPGSSGSISMTDSRLDPVMAHRRLSDGSIADNQDYSRRILRVTNA